MLPIFNTIEDNELGASDVRRAGGPLHVASVGERDPLHEDVITAGEALGWRVSDLNETDVERIDYAMATVRNGVRVSAAHALLHPIIARPNLTVWVLALTAATSLGCSNRAGRSAANRSRADVAPFSPTRPESSPQVGVEPPRRAVRVA